jgi:hypothetical protein
VPTSAISLAIRPSPAPEFNADKKRPLVEAVESPTKRLKTGDKPVVLRDIPNMNSPLSDLTLNDPSSVITIDLSSDSEEPLSKKNARHKELVGQELEAGRRLTKSKPNQLQPYSSLHLKNQDHLSQPDLTVVGSRRVLVSTPSSFKKERLQDFDHAAANPTSFNSSSPPKAKDGDALTFDADDSDDNLPDRPSWTPASLVWGALRVHGRTPRAIQDDSDVVEIEWVPFLPQASSLANLRLVRMDSQPRQPSTSI